MGLACKESSWAPSQLLEKGCQFGSGLPFDLFFFSSPKSSHYAMYGTSWCLGERVLDQEDRLGLPVGSWLFYTNI